MTKDELIEAYNSLVSNLNTKDNLPDWFSKIIKSIITKTISLNDWNTFVNYVSNNTSDSKSTIDFINTLYTYIIDYRATEYSAGSNISILNDVISVVDNPNFAKVYENNIPLIKAWFDMQGHNRANIGYDVEDDTTPVIALEFDNGSFMRIYEDHITLGIPDGSSIQIVNNDIILKTPIGEGDYRTINVSDLYNISTLNDILEYDEDDDAIRLRNLKTIGTEYLDVSNKLTLDNPIACAYGPLDVRQYLFVVESYNSVAQAVIGLASINLSDYTDDETDLVSLLDLDEASASDFTQLKLKFLYDLGKSLTDNRGLGNISNCGIRSETYQFYIDWDSYSNIISYICANISNSQTTNVYRLSITKTGTTYSVSDFNNVEYPYLGLIPLFPGYKE